MNETMVHIRKKMENFHRPIPIMNKILGPRVMGGIGKGGKRGGHDKTNRGE